MAIKNEHAFTIDALNAIIAKYGKRLKYIKTATTCIGVNTKLNNLPYVDTDNLVTFDAGGYDMLEVKMLDSFSRREYISVIRVEDICDFVVTENEIDHIDPFRL